MKQKLTVTVDPEVVVAAKRYARSRGVSLSNFYYLVAPARGGSDARTFITELIRFVAVADCGTSAMGFAVR